MKQIAMILIGLLLLPVLGRAEMLQGAYYTLSEIREQAAKGWHETYIDQYGREIVVDIDIEVFGGKTAPVLKVGLPDDDIYSDVDRNPHASLANLGKYGEQRMICNLQGERVDLDQAYGADYGNNLTLRDAYAFLADQLNGHGIPSEYFVYERPELCTMICGVHRKTGEVLAPAFYRIMLWQQLHELPILTNAMESFYKRGWPDFEPGLIFRMRNEAEYTMTVRMLVEQEILAQDMPLCALEQVIGHLESEIKAGRIQDVLSLRFGYSIYNDPSIQSRTPVSYNEAECYYAVPSWVLECKFMSDPKRDYRETTSPTCFTINAQTGKMLDYFDTSKLGFADGDYKGFISWEQIK